MRVLFVTNRYPTESTPGDSPCIAQQRAALEDRGHQVDVLYINSRATKLCYLQALGQVFWRAQILRRYDVVHAHYGFYCGLVARAQCNTPLLVTYRGSDVFDKNQLSVSRFVAKWATGIIVMNRQMKELLGRDDARVVPYGVDLEMFRPLPKEDARKQLGLPADVPLILFPYAPTRRGKRFGLIQQAVEILKGEFPGVEVVVIHEKPYESIPYYMNACDALLLTSITEGAPLSVREALACNMPIVSVDVGDVAEVIAGVEGCFVVERNPDEIAEKLAQVFRQNKRTQGREVALKMDNAQVAQEIERIYEKLSSAYATRTASPRPELVARRDSVVQESSR